VGTRGTLLLQGIVGLVVIGHWKPSVIGTGEALKWDRKCYYQYAVICFDVNPPNFTIKTFTILL